jgi:hypothetical protein
MSDTKATPTPGGQSAADKVSKDAGTVAGGHNQPDHSAPVHPDHSAAPGAVHGAAQGNPQTVPAKSQSGAQGQSPAASGARLPDAPAPRSSEPSPAEKAGAVSTEVHKTDSGAVLPSKRSEGTASASGSVITEFTGSVGSVFAIYGSDLSGDVLVNGRPVEVTSRRASSIKGTLPRDFKAGNASVQVGDATFNGKVHA